MEDTQNRRRDYNLFGTGGIEVNLKIKEFQKSIIDFVNKYDLPSEVKRLCLFEMTQNMAETADKDTILEIQQRDSRKEGDHNEQGICQN